VLGIGLVCNSRVGVSPTVVPVNFCPRVGKIPAAGLSLLEGKISTTELGSHMLPSGENSINEAAKLGLWEEEILQ